jgi:hypothetical protein
MHKKAVFYPKKAFLYSWLDFTAHGCLSVSFFFVDNEKTLQCSDYFVTLAAVAFVRRIIFIRR